MPKILNLDEYKSLFKDDASYQQLIRAFDGALEEDDTPLVLAEGEFLFAAVGGQDAQHLLCDRIVERLAKNPGVIEKLKTRFESEDLVE